MSTEVTAVDQVELTESVNVVESAAPVAATPVSSQASGLVMPDFMPQMPASQLRVSGANIDTLFDELDFDKSGALDTQEFKAFVLGRFDLPIDYVTELFNKYDKDGSKTIDKQEFREVISTFNTILQKFDEQEDKFLLGEMYKLAGIGYFMCLCCLCTVGTSYCCGSCCSITVVENIGQRILTKKGRLTLMVASETMGR